MPEGVGLACPAKVQWGDFWCWRSKQKKTGNVGSYSRANFLDAGGTIRAGGRVKKISVYTISLGCPKNQVDTEWMLGGFGAAFVNAAQIDPSLRKQMVLRRLSAR